MVGAGGIEIVSEVKAMRSQSTALLPGETELPMTVKDAARFLGVSAQTVYLWVERKQIPHLRVMGRSIRFLKSDLEPFRAQFKYEVENGKA
jgi:excisionase family DNA binding protein